MLLAPYPMTSYILTLWRFWLGEVRVTRRSPSYGIRGFLLASIQLIWRQEQGSRRADSNR
jgi:hypothetical protein